MLVFRALKVVKIGKLCLMVSLLLQPLLLLSLVQEGACDALPSGGTSDVIWDEPFTGTGTAGIMNGGTTVGSESDSGSAIEVELTQQSRDEDDNNNNNAARELLFGSTRAAFKILVQSGYQQNKDSYPVHSARWKSEQRSRQRHIRCSNFVR